ncbi:MAG: GspH/FimT family pseudopilin [Planctomycetota bacterium]
MSSRKQIQRRRGMTVIELSITVLVMGILAAVVAPSYVAAINRYRVDLAASRIVADLRFAQAESQRIGQTRTVQFDVSNDRYTLVDVADIDNSASTYVVELVDDPFLASLVSASFGFSANVSFDMFGRPDSSGAVVVQAGGIQKTVDLTADGTVSIP